MKKILFSIMLLGGAGLMLVCGCNGDDGKKDADADVTPDPQPDPDITVDPDVPLDSDIPGDPDAETGPEITPDLPETTEPEPDSTDCNPLYGGACNLIDNCGCTTGQACALNDLDPDDPCTAIEVCVASSGTLPTGSECNPASDQCAVGNTCLTNSLTGESKCYRWCDDDSDCEAGHSCSVQINFDVDGEGGECSVYTLEYKACDLGCPADVGCDPFTGTGCTDATNNSCLYNIDCGVMFCGPSDSSRSFFDDCSDTGLCPIGSECLSVDSGVTNLCYPFCSTENACDTGTCTPFGTSYDPIPGFGACIE